MSKRMFAIISMVIVIAMLGAFALVACDPVEPDPGPGPDDGKVTVTWYDGSTELRVDKVVKGSTLTEWTPEKDGHTFMGWFAEASKTDAFDFATIINEDTDIFAAFRSDAHVADSTEYYLIGTGAGDMGKSNWDHTASATNLKLTKDETVTNANVYTITLTMYAGDGFQICHDGSWDGQQGIGHMIGAEYCDGVNQYDKETYTAADKKVAQVLDANGDVVFVGSDEYNKGFEVWNIFLAEGKDGVYKFTYTTYPGQAGNNTLAWELVQAIEPLAKTHDMYFIGTMNGWNTDYTAQEGLNLVESSDKTTWTGVLTITEEHYADWTETDPANTLGVKCAAFKVFNAVDGAYHSVDGGNIFVTAGSYIVTYTVEGNSVTVTAENPAYYLVGTFVGADDAVVNFAINKDVTPSLSLNEESGLYEVTFAVSDVSSLGDFSWLADQGKGIFAIKVVYGTSAKIDTWYSAEGNDNWYFQEEGVYHVTLDPATGAVTITEEEPAYYIAGTLVDAAGNAKGWNIYKGVSPVLTLNSETGLYEVELEVTDVSGLSDYNWLAGSGIFAIKVVHGTSLGIDKDGWFPDATTNDNHVFTTPGTYLVAFDATAGTFTVTPVVA